MSIADTVTARLPASVSAPMKYPSLPMPSWQHTIRNLLSHLEKTVLTDSQLLDLHITFKDDQKRSMCASSETIAAIDAFFTSSTYDVNVRCLSWDIFSKPENTKMASNLLNSLLTLWTHQLASQHSENRVVFHRVSAKKSYNVITGDTYTRGLKTEMNARDMENGHSIGVRIRYSRQHEQLHSTELYTILALADEQRLKRPSASLFEVHLMVIHARLVRRLSVQVPLSFLTSMIDGERELVGGLHIHRTPWFDFYEEQGRRDAFQAVFEHFPLKTACTRPPSPIPTKRRRDGTRHKQRTSRRD